MYDKAHKYLLEHDVRPSLQRLAIMEYLLNNKTHPTVDEIFSALSKNIPGLSRATVYNTVSMLAERGAILSLDLGCGSIHYDGDNSPHAHFTCTRCGTVYDVFADDKMRELYLATPPKGYTVTSVQLSYKGVCEKCNMQTNYIYNN